MARFYALGAPILTASWAITIRARIIYGRKKTAPKGGQLLPAAGKIKLSLKACPRSFPALRDPLAMVSSAHML